jgi:hypothetical protein
MAEGRQRQLSGLAADPVPGGLVRLELKSPSKSATPRKRNIIAWRRRFRYWALKSPNFHMSVATPKGSMKLW